MSGPDQVAALARRGLAVHLVTGDNWRTARAIAEQLAIVNVCAECLPGGKADKMRVRAPRTVLARMQMHPSARRQAHRHAGMRTSARRVEKLATANTQKGWADEPPVLRMCLRRPPGCHAPGSCCCDVLCVPPAFLEA